MMEPNSVHGSTPQSVRRQGIPGNRFRRHPRNTRQQPAGDPGHPFRQPHRTPAPPCFVALPPSEKSPGPHLRTELPPRIEPPSGGPSHRGANQPSTRRSIRPGTRPVPGGKQGWARPLYQPAGRKPVRRSTRQRRRRSQSEKAAVARVPERSSQPSPSVEMPRKHGRPPMSKVCDNLRGLC